MKIRDFSKSKFKLPVGNLLTLPKRSWEKFWEQDLKALFDEVSPITDYTGKKLELHILDFYIEEPSFGDGYTAKKNNSSYEAPLYIKTKLVNLKTEKIHTQDVLLGNFPLLTEKGTFVIDGVERVAISQLIRSPGVFFDSRVVKGQKIFGAKIVPDRGAWIKFSTHWSGFIGVRVNRRRRLPATTLLRALGMTPKQIEDYCKDVVKLGEVNYLEKTFEQDPAKTEAEALLELYSRLRPGERATPEIAKGLINNMFFNPRRYDLGKVGRWKVWERLPETAPKNKDLISAASSLEERVLHKEDLALTLKEIIRLNNTPGAKGDVIDHLGNRRVRVFTELLGNSIRVGLRRMERVAQDRMASKNMSEVKPIDLINPRAFMGRVQSFFATGQMSQFMDNGNPLAEIEHKRRVTAKGPGGLTSERAGFEVRDVQPSHYGRVCPIQTSEGGNVGLVNHFSLYARANELGFIETPYFRVKKGRVTDELVYLAAFEEEKCVIASGLVLTDDSGKIIETKVNARIHGEPGVTDPKDIEYIDVSPEQILSVAPSLTPFQQSNDANRAMMGSNMQRQSLPLVAPEAPLVLSGSEEWVARDSGLQIRARHSGKITEVDGAHICLKFKNKGGKVVEESHLLKTFNQTNKSSCFHQRPVVQKGQDVKKGDILAEGGAIADGKLSLGKNLLVAFMSWRGANYEDAIVVSERLLKDDIFTSVRVCDFSCHVRETKLGPEQTTYDIPNVSGERLGNLDEEGIIRIGSKVDAKDILVGKVSPREKETLTAEERLLRAIFGEKAQQVKNTSLTLKHGERGKVKDIRVFSREEGHRLDPGVMKQIDIEVAERRKLTEGDKAANRHGNKGVITEIVSEEDMPFLEDGTPIDIVLNPTGIVKRMNFGQVLETHLGLAAKELGYQALSPAFSGASVEDIKEELKKAGYPESGKIKLFDGQTGKPFEDSVTVGYMYILKLDHMAEDKMHMRSIGPYSLITQQPLGGKAQFGGQRFGEMEVWALEAYGAAYTLQELLTIKSDDVLGRAAAYKSILHGEEIKTPTVPASFSLLVSELKALALDVVVQGSD